MVEAMKGIEAEVMMLIEQSGIVIPRGSYLELYHHLGPDRYREIGAAIVTCFNHDYCKKFIVLLPGQTLPMHAHRVKEETFTLLYGDVDGLRVGETLHIEPVTPHSLYSRNGAVLEEISTKYLSGDSRYAISSINDNPNRKTRVREF